MLLSLFLACGGEPVLEVDLSQLNAAVGRDGATIDSVEITVSAIDIAPFTETAKPGAQTIEIPITEGTGRRIELRAALEDVPWYWGVQTVQVAGKKTVAAVPVSAAGVLQVDVRALDDLDAAATSVLVTATHEDLDATLGIEEGPLELPVGVYGLAIDSEDAFTAATDLTVEQGAVVKTTVYVHDDRHLCAEDRPPGLKELAGCRTIGGTATGLTGSGLVLLETTSGSRAILDAPGDFAFPDGLLDDESFTIVVESQPTLPAQNCIVDPGAGTVDGDVELAVTCTDNTFSLFAEVAGLTGSGLILASGATTLPVSSDGVYVLDDTLIENDPVDVTVQSQPSNGQICEATLPEPPVMGPMNLTVPVSCRTPVSLGGSVSGLVGSGLVLDNDGEQLTLNGDGSFAFTGSWFQGETYDVTITQQPTAPQQSCSVTNGSGTFGGSDVNSVFVTCLVDTFTLYADVSGLDGSLTLNSGGTGAIITSDGVHPVRTGLSENDTIDLTVTSEPVDPEHDCTVDLAVSVMPAADVTADVTCRRFYPIGGMVSGLVGSGLVLDNLGETLSVGANGPFAFPTTVIDTDPYGVTVDTQPTGPRQVCTVSNGTGVVLDDVADITVDCVTESYAVEVVVSGLSGSVTVSNGGEDLVIGSDGTHAFPTPVEDEAAYGVTVTSQPATQDCTVSAGSGVMDGGPVQVAVDCVDLYDVDVDIVGLSGTVSLSLNGASAVDFTSDGIQPLGGPLDAATPFTVTLTDEQVGTDHCTVLGGSGSYTGAPVETVRVVCIGQPAFDSATWNDWRRSSDGSTPCTGAESDRSDCIHVSERGTVDVPVGSCADILGVSDGAFAWSCDDSAGVTLSTESVVDGLPALVDFGTGGWDDHVLFVDLADGTITTLPQPWFSGTIQSTSGGTISSSDRVVVVPASAGDVTATADGVTLAVESGYSGTVTVSGTLDRIEGDVVGQVSVEDSTWATVRAHVTASPSIGVLLDGSTLALIEQTTVDGSASHGIGSRALAFAEPRGTVLREVVSTRNGGNGIDLLGALDTRIVDTIVAGNLGYGVNLALGLAQRTIRTNLWSVRAFANGDHGIFVDNADGTAIAGLLASGNGGAGLATRAARGTLVQAATLTDATDAAVDLDIVTTFATIGQLAVWNADVGIQTDIATDNVSARDLALVGLDTAAVSLQSGSNYGFHGAMYVDDTNSCDVPASGSRGLFDDCSIAGASTATFTFGQSLIDTFVGDVTDSVNVSGGSGTAPWSPALDLASFESVTRMWGVAGTPGTAGVRGSCRLGTCEIRDWGLDAGDIVLTGPLAPFPPSGNDVYSHRWSTLNVTSQADCNTEFPGTTYNPSGQTCDALGLLHAVELDGDGIGNDNVLCETGEDCLWLPDIGGAIGAAHEPMTGPTSLSSGGAVSGIGLYVR